MAGSILKPVLFSFASLMQAVTLKKKKIKNLLMKEIGV